MTAVTDTKLILETLAGKTLADDKMILVVSNYVTDDRHAVIYPADAPATVDLTNEELAQRFLDTLMFSLRQSVRAGAEKKVREANDAAVATASDDSIVDL